MKSILILGAGTAGTLMANMIARKIPANEVSLTIIDKDPYHYYQPGFLFIPFGIYNKNQVKKDKARFLPKRANFILGDVSKIDAAANTVHLTDGKSLTYDYLIIATGSVIAPEETPGMSDDWHKTVFDFYTYEGSCALSDALKNFSGGNLVVHVNEMPIKCPVAPLEFTFLADWYFTKRKMRNKVNITYVTPLPGAFTKPVASKAIGSLLEKKNVAVMTEFNAERIDAAEKKIISYDGREVPFDLLVTIPTNMGSSVIAESSLGDELNFFPTDQNTLQSKNFPNIFAVGDATNIPASKAGAVAHFQAEVLIENIERAMQGKELKPDFDGHANCFIETGFNKAILIDFNYAVEPLPGTFPFPLFGPLSLLKETWFNHMGKLAFEWMYWNIIIKAIPIPFVPSQMKMMGKKIKS